MRITVPNNAIVRMETTFDGDIYITMSDDVAREIHGRMERRYFQEDFLNFLQVQHEDFEVCASNAFPTWSLLWESYQKHQDMNVAQWDTFEVVLQDVYEQCGSFVCYLCEKKLLSEFPPADSNGNCYCEHCASTQLDFCKGCGVRRLKSLLTYDKDGVAFCEHCKEEYIND